MLKIFYILAGSILMALGVLGIVLPGLPTTPFLLLALGCFTRGSGRIDQWFRGTGLYKKYLNDYMKDRSLSKQQKISVMIFVGIMITVSCLLIGSWIIRFVLVGTFLILIYVFLFVIKTRPHDKLEE